MRLSRSAWFLALVGGLLLLGLLTAFDAGSRHATADARFAANRLLARWLVFTDACLFTDARYARHASLADLHSAFQDAPLALEHFPSGALVAPPAHLAKRSPAGANRATGAAP